MVAFWIYPSNTLHTHAMVIAINIVEHTACGTPFILLSLSHPLYI
jgi:hypothetical protein